MTKLHPYLFFNGNCRQAMEFYKNCLGGELQMMNYAEAPAGEHPPAPKDWIMHACLKKDDLVLMASDGMENSPVKQGDYVFLSLHADNVPEAERLFQALSAEGKVIMPLEETFWAKRFGMLMDRFGMRWMINCDAS